MTDDNGATGSQHSIYLTSEGLTIEDDNFEGTGDVLALAIFSPSRTNLIPGDYEITQEGNVGDVMQLIAIKGFEDTASGQQFDAGYIGYQGTVKVGFANNEYTFDINVTSFVKVDEESEEEVVGGNFSAYFRGTLEDITPPEEEDELSRRPAGEVLPLIRIR